MIKYLLVAFLLCAVLLPSKIQSQDIIRTKFGKEMNCKITKIDSAYIYYSYVEKGLQLESKLSKNEVDMFAYNYFTSFPVADANENGTKQIDDYDRFCLAIDVGYGFRTGDFNNDDLSGEQQTIINGLRSGFTYGLSPQYYFSKNYGLGLKASLFNTQYDFMGYYEDETVKFSGYMELNSLTFFIGPQFLCRYVTPDKVSTFWAGLAVGYVYYNEAFRGNRRDLLSAKCETIGATLDIGYDIRITDFIKLGVGLNYSYATSSNITYELSDGSKSNLKLPEAGDLGRIGFSLGVRYSPK